ncbi:MAG: hypothetical protein AAF436_09260 [Myxococcota bacterium]
MFGTGGTPSTGGVGGSGNTATGGVGGDGGAGGQAGTGGAGATGGTGGTGGVGATGGTGGVGGTPECIIGPLCTSCPGSTCNSDDDCIAGRGCFPSGCETAGGAPIMQCLPNSRGSCQFPGAPDQCPSPLDPDNDNYACEASGLGNVCVKQTPGCDSDFDCPTGFACENPGPSGACIDRRVPCIFSDDCPVNYTCITLTNSARSCVRIHRDCEAELDCADLGDTRCVDVDNDGRDECVGLLDGVNPPCTNALCSSASAPVCEASNVGPIAACGQYGLCTSNGDCADSTFECLALAGDGRSECVKKNGSCDSNADCPANQVCAAPRTGGAPACQAGLVN